MGIRFCVIVQVDAVIVVPMRSEGIAYAHTPNGHCLTLAGPREKMVDLCKRVRSTNIESGPKIYVEADEFSDVRFVESNECPIHDCNVA